MKAIFHFSMHVDQILGWSLNFKLMTVGFSDLDSTSCARIFYCGSSARASARAECPRSLRALLHQLNQGDNIMDTPMKKYATKGPTTPNKAYFRSFIYTKPSVTNLMIITIHKNLKQRTCPLYNNVVRHGERP